jgi:outer membrane protein OmpA-like peptidoglycan-associated protein
MNLLDMVKDQVTGSLGSQAAKFLGESESSVGKALDGIFPVLLGKMADTAEDSNGLGKLFDMAKGQDTSILDDIGGLFGGGAGNVAKIMNGGSGVLNLLLGNSTGGLIDKIAGFSGLKGSAASSLIKMAAPFLMSMVGRHIKNKALDAVGFGKFLGEQKSHIKSSMPQGLLSSLGAGFLGKGASAVSGLASDGMDAGKKIVGGATGAAGKVVGGASDAAGKVVGGAADAGKKLVGGVGNVAGSAANMAGDVGGAAVKTGGSILRWLIPLAILLGVAGWFGIGPGLGGAADAAKGAVAKTADMAGDAAKGAADMAGDAAKGAADMAGDAAGAAGDAMKGAAGAVGGMFGKIDEAAKGALDKIKFGAGSAGSEMMKFIDGGFKGDGRFTFKNLTFATGSANIDGATAAEVDNMAAILKAYPGVKVNVEGYTDNTGNADANVQLSQARANAVKARLMAKGIDAARVNTKGFGAAKPVADNGTAEGRAQNRRIEMVIMK